MNSQNSSFKVLKVFEEDLKIRDALLRRDEKVTRDYFYRQCYPLFNSVFLHFYTDCECVKELIDEIYMLVMTVSPKTGKCQLENFKGESSLACWLQTVCKYYCYRKFKERLPLDPLNVSSNNDDEKDKKPDGDTKGTDGDSIEIDLRELNKEDALKLIALMPNKRYRSIIKMHYLEQKTEGDTAEALGMSIENFRNKRLLAIKQYLMIYNKEEKYGRTI